MARLGHKDKPWLGVCSASSGRQIASSNGWGAPPPWPRDPKSQSLGRSPGPGDDYLIALAELERAALVSGDQHLLGQAEDLPDFSPIGFSAMVKNDRGSSDHSRTLASPGRSYVVSRSEHRLRLPWTARS
jgi:hypothetical protein